VTNGVVELQYEVRDPDGAPAAGTVTVTVASVNDAPVAAADAYATSEDMTLVVGAPGLVGNDDGDPLTTALAAGPAHGTVIAGVDGSFAYTPAADYHGPDSFTYTVDDGRGGTAAGAVSLTVTSVNDRPTAAADAYGIPEDVALVVGAQGLIGNDGDADGDPLTSALAAGPAHGSITVGSDGSFMYTPGAGYHGPDSFTYTVDDGHGATAAGAVSLTVAPSLTPTAWYLGTSARIRTRGI